MALSVGGNGQSTTFSGNLTGPGSLTKTGPGTLTLTGANTFAGSTTVNGGTLQLAAGSLAPPRPTNTLAAAVRAASCRRAEQMQSTSISMNYISDTTAAMLVSIVLAATACSRRLDVEIGYTGTGHFTQSGGLLSAGHSEFIGDPGTGTYTQSGGTNSVTYLKLNQNAGYNLSGSGLLTAYTEVVGENGSCTFTQNGGTNPISGSLTWRMATVSLAPTTSTAAFSLWLG